MYTISLPSGDIRLDGVLIVPDPNSAAWAAYIAWVGAGNGPTPIPDPIPQYPRITISAWQVVRALLEQGLYDQIDTGVMNSGDRQLIATYKFAPSWQSDCPALMQNLATLGLTEQSAYDIFIAAQSVPEQGDRLTQQDSTS